MKVVVQLQRTKAHLPELSITGVPGECYPDRQDPVGRQASALLNAVHHRRWARESLPLPSRGCLASRHLMLAVDVRVLAAGQTP